MKKHLPSRRFLVPLGLVTFLLSFLPGLSHAGRYLNHNETVLEDV